MRPAILTIAASLMLIGQALVAADASFGESVNGLRLSIAQVGDDLQLVLENRGPEKAQLEDSFAWILLAESRDKAYFTPKLALSPPAELNANQSRELAFHAPAQPLLIYQPGAKVAQGYPQIAEPKTASYDQLPSSLRAQAVAYVQLGGERVTVKSRAIAIMPHMKGASTAPAGAAELIEQFRRDAFAAKAAHDRAVKLGPSAIPALKAALADRTMPDFGSMWIATAILHIGGADAEAAAVDMTTDPREGVRYVLAYHGPTMNSKRVDDAILSLAGSSPDQLFTAWAARGFSEHGRPFPPRLVDAALASKEPRARAEIAHVLARNGDLERIAKLCTDPNELVRVAAADAIAEQKLRDPAVVAAMVRALEIPGDAARQRMVESAGKILGREWTYDAQASDSQLLTLRQEILRAATD